MTKRCGAERVGVPSRMSLKTVTAPRHTAGRGLFVPPTFSLLVGAIHVKGADEGDESSEEPRDFAPVLVHALTEAKGGRGGCCIVSRTVSRRLRRLCRLRGDRAMIQKATNEATLYEPSNTSIPSNPLLPP